MFHRMPLMYNVLIFSLVFFAGCQWQKENDGEGLVVKVFDKVLTEEDVSNVIPQNASQADSIDISEKFIQEWVTKELLLEKARINVGENEEIRRMVDGYESSLLVKMYLQLLVEQKADNEPTADEIAMYYEDNKDNFVLQDDILKGSFLKLRKDAPRLKDVKRWMNSDAEKDMLELDDYCFQNATNYDKFNDQWMSVTSVNGFLPEELKYNSRSFREGSVLEQTDSLYIYYLKLASVKMVNDTAPLEFVSPKINKILRHQKKLNYLNSLKKSIYNEAIKDKDVVFYDKH